MWSIQNSQRQSSEHGGGFTIKAMMYVTYYRDVSASLKETICANGTAGVNK